MPLYVECANWFNFQDIAVGDTSVCILSGEPTTMTELLGWLFQRDTALTIGAVALAFMVGWWSLSVALSLCGVTLGWLHLQWKSAVADTLRVNRSSSLPNPSPPTALERDMAKLQGWARQHGVHWLDKPVGELATLTWANLYRTKLSQLPEALCAMPVLERLDLRFNPLTHLPQRLGDLQQLQSIDVYESPMSQLPPSFTQLHRLHYCQLVARLTTLPEDIGNLRALTFLDLSGNQLAALPDSMRQLTALQTLKLTNNRLTELPDWIGHLPALVFLDVRGNPLIRLPPSLGQSTHLRYLAHDASVPAVELARWQRMREGPLGHIQVAFAQQMSYFGHELPLEAVRLRRNGMLCADEDGGDYGYGDAVRYRFDRDEHGEYLDYYLRHRLAGDRHVRIREDGHTEDLDVIPNWRPCSDDPVQDASLQAQYMETVNRISRMLSDKGFA